MIEFVCVVVLLYFFWEPIEEWIESIAMLVKRCRGSCTCEDCGCNKNKKQKTKKGAKQT